MTQKQAEEYIKNSQKVVAEMLYDTIAKYEADKLPIVEEEFIYPMWFKCSYSDTIVKFVSLYKGLQLVSLESWTPHIDTNVWTQIEDPTIIKAPKTERRGIWLKDYDGYTEHTLNYVSNDYATGYNFTKDGWYKSEMYIDVEIKE